MYAHLGTLADDYFVGNDLSQVICHSFSASYSMVLMQVMCLSCAVVSRLGEAEYLGPGPPVKVFGDRHDLQRQPKSKGLCRCCLLKPGPKGRRPSRP